MTDLDRALRDLGEHLDYPPAPHFAVAVRRRLARPDAGAGPRPVPWAGLRHRRLVTSLAAAAIVVLSGVMFWAPAREAVADLFGLPGVLFSREPSPVQPGEGDPPPVMPPLGRAVSLDAARSLVDFPLRIPARLGPPPSGSVYVDEAGPEPVVFFVYRPGPALPEVRSTGIGFLVSQFRGRFDTAVMQKFLGPGSGVEAISVAGHRGFWLPEPAHVVLYLDRQGNVREDTARLTANVLLWEQDGVITRLESHLSRDEMLAVAASVN